MSNAQSQPPSCVENWYSLTDAERAQCEAAVGGPVAVMETNEAIDFATAAARPSSEPMAGVTAMAQTYVALGSPTEVPTIPAGVLPEQYLLIEQIEPEDIWGTSESYKYNASVWHIGGELNENGMPEMLFAATPRDFCAVRTFRSSGNNFINPQIWECPENVGEVLITGVASSTGLISFTTIQSDTGTFDLSTKEWTLNDAPWISIPYLCFVT